LKLSYFAELFKSAALGANGNITLFHDDGTVIISSNDSAGAQAALRRVEALTESVKVGKPLIAGAKVMAELVEQTRGPKLIAFKKRRRKNSRRKKGHRQDLTKVRITDIIGA